MYHEKFKKSHYEAGFHWGKRLYCHNQLISQQKTFIVNEERKAFAKQCIPLYAKYYPEILEEIKGIADGQDCSYEDLCTFLLSMYCFEFQNKCTCFAFCDEDHIFLCRNSDFLVALEKLYMNCIYQLHHVYAFQGNTTSFVEMEDGMNEKGLAVGLTFVYPDKRKPGLNAGMLVRYLLEKCQTTDQAIRQLQQLPIASSQTLTLADRFGNIAVIECDSENVVVIKTKKDEKFVVTTNHFHSLNMKNNRNTDIDDWFSDERYRVAYHALKQLQTHFTKEDAQNILAGQYGFMCQYDRKMGADTVWSVIYDCLNKRIWRVEGNPSRKKFKEDIRMNWES